MYVCVHICRALYNYYFYVRFEEGLNIKVKLDIDIRFGRSVEFKKYLRTWSM